jgi:hypothetical protein
MNFSTKINTIGEYRKFLEKLLGGIWRNRPNLKENSNFHFFHDVADDIFQKFRQRQGTGVGPSKLYQQLYGPVIAPMTTMYLFQKLRKS